VDSDGPKESCVRWGVQIPYGKGQFGGKGAPIVKYRDTLRSHVQKQLNSSEPIMMPLWARTGPRNHELDGGTDLPMRRGNFGGKGHPL